MISRRAYTLSLLCLVVSCSSPGALRSGVESPIPETVNVTPDMTTVNTDIRPGPNGPKLELVSLEGELLIPRGTSSFVLKDSTQLSFSTQMMRVISPPAYAALTGDEPIESKDLQAFVASVNGQIVPMTVLSHLETDDGLVLSYRLHDVPASNLNTLLEFKSPSNAFVIRGVVEKVEKTGRLPERLDLDSTALAYFWESLKEERPEYLSQQDLLLLESQDTVQNIKQVLYKHYIRPEMKANQRAQAVSETLSLVLSESLQNDSEALTFLKKAKQCQSQKASCELPILKNRAVQALPASLVKLAELRTEERKKKQQFQETPIITPPESTGSTQGSNGSDAGSNSGNGNANGSTQGSNESDAGSNSGNGNANGSTQGSNGSDAGSNSGNGNANGSTQGNNGSDAGSNSGNGNANGSTQGNNKEKTSD